MSTEEPDRSITLDGCCNFRDLGGYPTADGRKVRWRHLFRADGLSRLTAADLDQLDGLGLRTVIDLRTTAEVAARGRVEWPTEGLSYHHLPMLDVLPSVDDLPRWSEPAYVAEQYLVMLSGGQPSVREALAVLSDPSSYPAVYHCTAGKDRTGILSAVVLGLLGVDEHHIVEDYALSREGMQKLLDRLLADFPGFTSALTSVTSVEPDSMQIFLQSFREQYGTFGSFAADIGVDDQVTALRDILLSE
jgi:protein-tyrosine phosphatase